MEYMNASSNHTRNRSLLYRGDDELSQGVAIFLYTAIFISALIGNMLVIITLIQNKRMRTVTNVFLLNLAISDLLLALFCMPFNVIPMLMRNFIFGSVVCFLVRYLQGVSVGVSGLTLLAISLERYFAICRPLHSRRWQTLSHAYKMIGGIWGAAFTTMVPIAIHVRHSKRPSGIHTCRELWTIIEMERAYTVFLDLSLLIIPLVVMSIAYGCVIVTLWNGMQTPTTCTGSLNGKYYGSQHNTSDEPTASPSLNTDLCSPESTPQRKTDMRRLICHSNPERSRAAKLRVIRMLCAVVIEYFICWSPFYAIQTWKSFHEHSLKKYFSNLTLSLIYMLAFLSSSCNPVTYCLLNKRFRQSFSIALRCFTIKPLRRFSSRSRSEQMTSLRVTTRHASSRLAQTQKNEIEKATVVVGNVCEGIFL